RERATRELEQVAPLVERALRAALAAGPSLEKRRRLEGILERMRGWVPSPEQVRGVRGGEALERAGTAAGIKVLENVANGAAEVGVTQEARASLRRLGARP